MTDQATEKSTDAESAREARKHVGWLKATFGQTPTWGMVEMAYRTGWYARETGWRYD